MKKKGILLALTAFLAVGAVAGGVAMFNTKADTVYFAELFEGKGFSVLTDNKIDGDERQGLAMVTQRKNTAVNLVNGGAGEFSMDFKFYTESEDYYLTEAVLTFQDETRADNSFDLHINNGALGVSYFVTVNGQNAGVYYEEGNSAFLTTEYNKKSMYTRVESDADMILSFDPISLCVYVQTDALHKYLVWDLSSKVNDGRDVGASLLPFGSYDISLHFSDFSVKPDAPVAYSGLQVFEMNGQSMNGIAIADNAAPTLHAKISCDAVAGNVYTVPTPYAYDVKDGALSGVITTVKNAGGETVAQGTENVVFTPTEGNYTIVYEAEDGAGRKTAVSYPLQANGQGFDAKTVISSTTVFADDTVGVGSELTLPQVFADGALNKTNALIPLNLTVSVNGTELEGYSNQSAYAGKAFVFEQSGEYKFTFVEALGNLPESHEVVYTVLENVPKFTLGKEIPSAFNLNGILPTIDYAFTVNGESLPASAKLVYPDGTEQPLSQNALSLAGYYTAVFQTEYEGKTFEHKKTFTVNIEEYSTTGDGVAFYGVAEKYDQKRGLIVCLENETDEFTYNKVIDLKGFDGKTPILSMYALPREQGKANVEDIFVTLTDIYDSSNKLVIKYQTRMADIGWYPLYVLGSATKAEQPFLGVYNNGVTSATGAMTFVETAKYNGGAILLGYDITTNTAYTNRPGVGATDMIIADFDDEAHFESVWSGFTTGEVYLSISAGKITERAELLVEKIGGYDLTAEGGENTKEPRLRIDYMGYDEKALPVAFLEQNYPLLPYTAKDLTGHDCTTKITVQKDGKFYEVQNGGFVPDLAGEYLVTYTAFDGFGTSTAQSYTVKATAKTTNLSLEVVNFNAQAYIGYEYTLASYGVYGQVGKANVTVSYRNLAGGEWEYATDKTVVFATAGTYAIRYEATDYINRKVEVVKYLKVEPKAELLFKEEIAVPFATFNGGNYLLPDGYASYKNADGTDGFVKASVSVVDGGETVRVINGVYTPNRPTEGTVKVVYTAEKDGYASAVYEREVLVLNNKTSDGALAFEKYFVTDDGLSVHKTATGVTMTAQKDGKIRFVNPVVADGSGVSLQAVEEGTSARAINLYFMDSLDKSIVVKLGVVYSDDTQSALFLNDAKRTNFVNGSFTDSKSPLEFSLDNTSKSVFNNNGLNLTIEKTLAGNPFEGFPSGKVYIEFEFTGVTQESSLKLTKINNQQFNVTRDTARAQVVKMGDFGGRTDIHSVATTATAIVADVLSPNTTVMMTVYDPDLQVVTSIDGIKLENVPCDRTYQILCDKYGDYEVLYTGSDNTNKAQSTSYVLNVVDATLPTITVEWTLHDAYKVGDSVQLPKMVATDENGIEYSWIIVEDASGRVYILSGEAFTFKEKGEYIFSYVAYDTKLNMSVVSFTVTVQ